MSKRIRAHINPFKCRVQLFPKDWLSIYNGGALHVDIGCAKGEFIARLAQLNPKKFFIGIELRNSVAEKYFGNFKETLNLVLLTGNANMSINTMFAGHAVDTAYLNFPDPYSHKLRLKKRRIVTAQFVSDLYGVMNAGGKVYFQTDDSCLYADAHQLFTERFLCTTDTLHPEQVENLSGAVSSWESECMRKGTPVYRAVYEKR